MKKTKLFYTDKGYSYVKCTKEDCFSWGGLAICDDCSNNFEEGYLIYVLNRALCHKCFEDWLKRSVKYDDDLYLQKENHISYYKAHGYEILDEEKEDV